MSDYDPGTRLGPRPRQIVTMNHNFPPPIACALPLVIALLAGGLPAVAQGQAPAAQVPGRVTSAPASAFDSQQPPLPALPTDSAPPPVTDSNSPVGPALPSIEAQQLPLPTTLSTPPPSVPVPSDRTPSPPRPTAPATAGAPVQGPSLPSGVRGRYSAELPPTRLPAPIDRPLAIDASSDAVLQIGMTVGAVPPFRDAIVRAIQLNPALGEAEAQAAEARAAKREARAALLPSADVNLTSYTTLSRAFSNDINNIIERSRPRGRTDAQIAINQTLYDFGASASQISASTARIRAAASAIDDTAAQIALRTIAAWYDIFTYRALLSIGRTYYETQALRRADFAQRIAVGASAEVDVARLDSSLAGLQTRLARFERQEANAEAQFAQLTGQAAPATLFRAPFLGQLPANAVAARDAVQAVPAVRTAAEQARAAEREARSANRSILPNISAGIDAGRYGVIETSRDYDIRARITLRQKLGFGYSARVDQIKARANGAAARANRVEQEAARDAAIAWTDFQALNRQTEALEQAYLAARQSRDTIDIRFKISRGTLFDVINANDSYFAAAASYIESLADRDAAHYVLLARTGRLLDALQIDSAYEQARK